MLTTEAEPAGPWAEAWAGRLVVVKYGGSVMADAGLSDAFMQDLVDLQALGVRVLLVHGGGAAVTELGRRMGLESRFVDGLRVTDPETMRLAQLVQVGGISRDILTGLARAGGRGVGLSGQDGGGWLRATLRVHVRPATGERVDLGRVGDISHVDPRLPELLLDAGLLPVVAPVAVDAELEPLNVNADSVATALAAALGAARLVLLTDVAGIRGADGALATELSAAQVRAWIAEGVIDGGMIPKAEGCLDALEAGVASVTIADGRVPHALRQELLTDAGQGTLITP
ncbi:MAG: acetylglutamate kinase [Alphaproteobacteria bacterium]|nr:acetylglutamate kinase [Alphaproteobacteria bacterium]MCB9796903.1 acetylglutamate kinase [Alphaproteobacteria bacterium]